MFSSAQTERREQKGPWEKKRGEKKKKKIDGLVEQAPSIFFVLRRQLRLLLGEKG